MYENLTPEQSDALILEALSPSSGTNEQEQYEDAPESTEEVEEETEEVQETESDEDGTDSEPEQPKEKSKNSNVPKLVAQRNEARREAQELRKQLAEINKAKLNEKYDPESISDFRFCAIPPKANIERAYMRMFLSYPCLKFRHSSAIAQFRAASRHGLEAIAPPVFSLLCNKGT